MTLARTRILAPECGLHAGVDFDTYLKWSALSQSDLKGARTMRHLRHRLDAVPDPAGPAQSKGTAFHTLLLEPSTWAERCAVCPVNPKSGESFGRATKAWEEWAETQPGKTLISQSESRDVERMAAIAGAHPTVKMLAAAKGESEISAVWRDPDFGVLCKARFDRLIVTESVVTFADFKTTEDASPEKFGRDAYSYGYHFQAAFYRRALQALLPGRTYAPWIVAIESDEPHCVATYSIDDETLRVGEVELLHKLRAYSKASKTNEWPGYENEAPLVLPAWAYKRAEMEGL